MLRAALGWALPVLLLPGCVGFSPAGPPLATAPPYESLTPYLCLPPALEDRLLYYNAFEEADGKPEISRSAVAQLVRLETREEGVRGRCGMAGKGNELRLRSEAFSPHRPLTVSFWWSFEQDAKIDSSFGLVHLAGRQGFVSHFSRGKGEWCALQRPAAILQVYYIPGIQNVNGIYDSDLAAHVELKAGKWHHTALVFSGASLIEVYTDGRRAWSVRVRGRAFREDDRFHDLWIGTRSGMAMAIDEVMVLRRALTAGEIAEYFTAISQMREVGYPPR